MVQSLLVLALAGMLSLGLTSCGMGNNDPQTGGNNGQQTGGNNNTVTENGPSDNGGSDNSNDVSMNGTGDVGNINNDGVGNAAPNTNDNSNTQAKRSTNWTPNIHRSAYDYLNDGRYRASSDGNIIARKDTVGNDLTQGARDLIRGTGDMVGDVGRGVGNAARDVGRAAGNTLRDMTR